MKQKMKVSIVTLGCEKNLVDSEIMLGLVDENGYEITDDQKNAEVIVVNTCGFIDASKEESINTILQLAEYKKTAKLKSLVVAGCLSQRYKDELIQEIPEIDGLVGTGEFDRIVEVINKSLDGKKPIFIGNPIFSYDRKLPRRRSTPSHYAYIKIAEGCDNSCTFCVIPSLRGKFRSRGITSIVNEAMDVVAQGVKEISLIAQDTSYYGIDKYDELMLPTLINELSRIDGLYWIRLHYLYPGYITDELIEVFEKNPKLCKYIDIPLQHSEDHILKKMLRPGRQTDIRALISKLRKRIPDVALRTSIIVGFPGETEEDFNNLVEFVKEIKFDRLGVFTYSEEEGTPASRLPNQVPQEEKERRAQILMEVQREIANENNSKFIGKELKVLIDRYDEENDVYIGRTQYDAPEIDGEVFVSNIKANVGDIVTVRITHSYDFDLVGEGISNESAK
ncbi:ribosomal protein S12 methylthiotransferase RimO [Vulcanibacillus modesticaldus]|uniref:Ribosomal protein uS12 methylthiotransferase RimO n=1 Tax=Vulcanibacillus modesticaldus TaxID=337097 RepID=A0A1D2YXR5_9BACI|nr:30S ribosomal protein S12 methylthiotransferase RimO [Vulcanibacillus modesticaldus]OEG00470.1 ribosomal protein S12 methylthiotransferase RimO [Vulcanibacillus modesticaldus]